MTVFLSYPATRVWAPHRDDRATARDVIRWRVPKLDIVVAIDLRAVFADVE